MMKPLSFLLVPLICPEELRLGGFGGISGGGFLVVGFMCVCVCLMLALGHCLVEENFLAAIVN